MNTSKFRCLVCGAIPSSTRSPHCGGDFWGLAWKRRQQQRLQQQSANAATDAERLNWLEQKADAGDLRECIDEARKKEKGARQ